MSWIACVRPSSACWPDRALPGKRHERFSMSEESGGRAQGSVTLRGRPEELGVNGARPMEMLVFDVGMNVGMDTAFYLSKGCRVIAVEANPVLCEQARHRFANALRSGQLIIEEVGVADDVGTATFYVNDRN